MLFDKSLCKFWDSPHYTICKNFYLTLLDPKVNLHTFIWPIYHFVCPHLFPKLCCCCWEAKLWLILLGPHWLQPTKLMCPRDFTGKNTGVCCHFPLQGIFPTQGWTTVSCLAGAFLTTEPSVKPSQNLRDCVLHYIWPV